MRSTEEILTRIKACESRDWLGFERSDLIGALPFHDAKPFLKEDVAEKSWRPFRDNDDIRRAMVDYMPFAWEKANNCRGISAGRSICHFMAWLWLLGEDWADELEDYEFYGKPQLVRICEFLGLDATQWDDGVRTN